MPLDIARLSAAMRAGLKGNANSMVAPEPPTNAALTALCDELAKAVINEIKANGTVLPTALIAPPGTAGGPVTGTGTIT